MIENGTSTAHIDDNTEIHFPNSRWDSRHIWPWQLPVSPQLPPAVSVRQTMGVNAPADITIWPRITNIHGRVLDKTDMLAVMMTALRMTMPGISTLTKMKVVRHSVGLAFILCAISCSHGWRYLAYTHHTSGHMMAAFSLFQLHRLYHLPSFLFRAYTHSFRPFKAI